MPAAPDSAGWPCANGGTDASQHSGPPSDDPDHGGHRNSAGQHALLLLAAAAAAVPPLPCILRSCSTLTSPWRVLRVCLSSAIDARCSGSCRNSKICRHARVACATCTGGRTPRAPLRLRLACPVLRQQASFAFHLLLHCSLARIPSVASFYLLLRVTFE